jgi:quinolinate synthase
VADFVGDSLELSRKAAATDAEVIIFCGVHFMAETAVILCPDKTVLLPDLHAGCPMANMITAKDLREKKSQVDGLAVVCYVNSTGEVKAESDICCTSGNAVKVVQSISPSRPIAFVPDQYLGSYVSGKTGRELDLWPGYCPTHQRILPEDILRLKGEHPRAKAIVHPECRREVVALADETSGTGGMCRFARETDAQEIIVGTEIGMLHRLRRENPGKRFIPASEQAICPNMKLITLEKVLWSLEEMRHRVTVSDDIRRRAKRAVDQMIAMA